MKIVNWERLFVHHRIVSAVKRAEFVSDRISYRSERLQYIIIILNVQAPTEEKSNDSKENFYEVEYVFQSFS
jgi:hypothetical protein